MNRRAFLGALGALAAAPAVPALPVPAVAPAPLPLPPVAVLDDDLYWRSLRLLIQAWSDHIRADLERQLVTGDRLYWDNVTPRPSPGTIKFRRPVTYRPLA